MVVTKVSPAAPLGKTHVSAQTDISVWEDISY